MSRSIKMVLVVAIAALVMLGCENPTSSVIGGDGDDGGDETSDTNFSATINGQFWGAADASVVFQSDNLNIKGDNPEAEFDIWLTLPDDISPGTYSLTTSSSGDPQAVLIPPDASSGTHYPDPEGTLVIEQHDTDNYNIKGTFAFEAVKTGDSETYSVTNGQFDFDGEFYTN